VTIAATGRILRKIGSSGNTMLTSEVAFANGWIDCTRHTVIITAIKE